MLFHILLPGFIFLQIFLQIINFFLSRLKQQTNFFCIFFFRYASGTVPWGNPNASGFEPQKHDDGYLEVIGFTYSSLVS